MKLNGSPKLWTTIYPVDYWLCFLVKPSDLRLNGREFDSPPPWGWVTVFGWINYLSISLSQPGQLSLLPSVGRQMSTSQSEVTFCGPGVKAGLFHFGRAYGLQVKPRNPLLIRALPQRLRDDRLIISAIQIRLLLVDGYRYLWDKFTGCY